MSMLVFLFLLVAFDAFVLVLVLSRKNTSRTDKAKAARQPASDAGVRDLVAQGQMDEAVDVYRRFTGVDVFTAKSAVLDMQTEMRLSSSEPEIRRLLRLGDKAGAIETYQQATGVPLADALAAVEAMEQHKER